jgi:hypothetical protein
VAYVVGVVGVVGVVQADRQAGVKYSVILALQQVSLVGWPRDRLDDIWMSCGRGGGDAAGSDDGGSGLKKGGKGRS